MHININKRTIPLYCDGQQFHQYQQNKQSPLNIDGQQFTDVIVCFVDIGGIVDHHSVEVIDRFVDVGENC
jgi:hypothetical protein